MSCATVPPELHGSFEMGVADAMRAQKAALESDGWTVELGPPGPTHGEMTARNAHWKAMLTFDRANGGAGTLVVRMIEF